MGRKKKHDIWDQFEESNRTVKCKHCGGEFRGRPSVTRLKRHLEGTKDGGIRICKPIVDRMNEFEGLLQHEGPSKRSRTDQVEPNSSNELVDNWLSTDLLQQRNQLEEIAPDGGETRQPEFEDVEQQTEQTTSHDSSDEDVDAEDDIMEDALLTTRLVGNSIHCYMRNVLSNLNEDEVLRIGIYGMGGVGKTELAKHIHNQLLKKKSNFRNVYWVTVSPHFTIYRLQNDIAKAVKLDLSNEDDENKRAKILYRTLIQKEKSVLILDDVWRYIPLESVGVPISLKACKLVFTTRSLEICRMMRCQHSIHVDCFQEDEGEDWKLFIKTLGHDIEDQQIIEVAECIVEECEGLPLMIISMARSMTAVDGVRQWRNTLEKLKESKWGHFDNMQVYEKLKLSYDYLGDLTLKRCFLYCALFDHPLDEYLFDFKCSIDEKQLTQHLIAERIIERKGCRQAEYDEVHGMLMKLQNNCLLEEDYEGFRMHGVIRKMAIQILEEICEGGRQLKFLPHKKCWAVGNPRILKVEDDIQENSSTYSTLIFRKAKLELIEDSFFDQMHGLKILNLSYTAIKKLPKSVGCLKNLRAMFLRVCLELTDVPSLAALGLLEVLDFSNCKKLKQLPQGVEELFNLKYFNLYGTGVTDSGSRKFMNNRLQFLVFGGYAGETGGITTEELAELRQLETLMGWFLNTGELNKYLRLLRERRQHLITYKLIVGRALFYSSGIESEHGQKVILTECSISKHLLDEPHHLTLDKVWIEDGCGLCLKDGIHLKSITVRACEGIIYLFSMSSSPLILKSLEDVKVEKLNNLHFLFGREDDDHEILAIPNATTFSHLKFFYLKDCRIIEKLFPHVLLPNLKNLEEISVIKCSQLKEIISTDEATSEGIHSTCNLPSLTTLSLLTLPELKSISTSTIKCKSLQKFTIMGCSKLKYIPIDPSLPSLKELRVEPIWWESVEWGSPQEKAAFQPIYTS